MSDDKKVIFSMQKLSKTYPGADKQVLKNIYFAFVHSCILYGVEIYANTSPTHLDRLIKLNNKLLRILQNMPRCCHTKNLYSVYDTLNIPNLHKQQILMLVHKFVHHSDALPDIFKNYFAFSNEIHRHNTRSTCNIYKPRVNTAYGLRAVTFKGVSLWNKLPDNLKQITSTSLFKQKLKCCLREEDRSNY